MHLRLLLAPLMLAALLSFTVTDRQLALSQTGQASGAIGYASVPVRRTGIRFPRLMRFRDQRVMREVNRQIDEFTKDFGCSGKDSYYKVRSKVAYAGKDIFSIYASAQYYCGGPYPTNDDNISQTFDLRTGKKVSFEELFNSYETNKREILKTIFATQVARAEKAAASGKNTEDSCEGPDLYSLDNLEGSTFAYNFSSAGLQVQPSWPHVVEACAEIVTVPYSRLAGFAAPNGLLARMSK